MRHSSRYCFILVRVAAGATRAGRFVLPVGDFVDFPGRQHLRHFQPILTKACVDLLGSSAFVSIIPLGLRSTTEGFAGHPNL